MIIGRVYRDYYKKIGLGFGCLSAFKSHKLLYPFKTLRILYFESTNGSLAEKNIIEMFNITETF